MRRYNCIDYLDKIKIQFVKDWWHKEGNNAFILWVAKASKTNKTICQPS